MFYLYQKCFRELVEIIALKAMTSVDSLYLIANYDSFS